MTGKAIDHFKKRLDELSEQTSQFKGYHTKFTKAFKHIAVCNEEMGSVDSRLGRMEGQIAEFLPQIKSDVETINQKLDNISKQSERLAVVEDRVNNIVKSRYGAMIAITGGLITYFLAFM